ncbi:MAG: DUF2007 domain-containing protein, partial [candidate division WOR-3 bacterium]
DNYIIVKHTLHADTLSAEDTPYCRAAGINDISDNNRTNDINGINEHNEPFVLSQSLDELCFGNMIEYSMIEDIEFIEVLQTTDATEIEVIKSILNNAEIKYYFKGQALGRIFPTMNKPVRLMVQKERFEEAMEILKGHGKKR